MRRWNVELLRSKNNKVIAFLILTITLIVARDIFSFKIPMIVFTILTIIVFLLSNSSDGFLYIIALLPFCRGMPYSEMIVATLLLDFIKRCSSFDWNIKLKYYIPIVFITIIELMDYFVFNIPSNEILYLIAYMLFVSYAIDKKMYIGNEYRYLIAYALTTLASVFIVVIREINLYGLDYIMTYNVRFGANTNGLIVTNYNSNELGLYCCVAVAVLLMLQLENKQKSLLILAVVISITGMVSVSRSYILAVLMIWIIYLIKNQINIKILFYLGFVLLIAVLAINKFFPEVSQWLIHYYETRSMQASLDGLGGRVAIFSNFTNAVFANIYTVLFGYSEMYGMVLESGAVHNGTQEIIVSWGIVGFIIAVLWIYNLVKSTTTLVSDKKKIRYFPFVIFLLYIQTIQFFTMHNYLLVMMVCIIAISYVASENSRGDQLWIKN